jgi:hypothetical protein
MTRFSCVLFSFITYLLLFSYSSSRLLSKELGAFSCNLEKASVFSSKLPFMDRRGHGNVTCTEPNSSKAEFELMTNCKTLVTHVNASKVIDDHGKEADLSGMKWVIGNAEKGSEIDLIGLEICNIVGREWSEH